MNRERILRNPRFSRNRRAFENNFLNLDQENESYYDPSRDIDFGYRQDQRNKYPKRTGNYTHKKRTRRRNIERIEPVFHDFTQRNHDPRYFNHSRGDSIDSYQLPRESRKEEEPRFHTKKPRYDTESALQKSSKSSISLNSSKTEGNVFKCPHCGHLGKTLIKARWSMFHWIFISILCSLGCCLCALIPLCCSFYKIHERKCRKCKKTIEILKKNKRQIPN
ncbi:unnamed protein product [Moneuplotes crassus]|uniref:LITAF domain-containing protein n=1 Tax=Euplotes crassus TaxID=5936 RepID=A0AAD2CY09_EUPCR|nr:unnamed protein product [Moneuplotes crassus]